MQMHALVQQGSTLLEQQIGSVNIATKEALALLAHAMDLRPEELLGRDQTEITAATETIYHDFLARRAAHEPLAYILGTAPFLGREFTVTTATLIPRPATEILAEAFLEALPREFAGTVIDVGTGSGCVAISCALARPHTKVIATDLSAAALEIAERNAERHQAQQRLTLTHTNGIAALAAEWQKPVAVIANLPYLPDDMWPNLAPELTQWEPRSALTSGADGMDAYRELVTQLTVARPQQLTAMAWELLPAQYDAAAALIQAAFPTHRLSSISNYQGVTIGILATA